MARSVETRDGFGEKKLLKLLERLEEGVKEKEKLKKKRLRASAKRRKTRKGPKTRFDRPEVV